MERAKGELARTLDLGKAVKLIREFFKTARLNGSSFSMNDIGCMIHYSMFFFASDHPGVRPVDHYEMMDEDRYFADTYCSVSRVPKNFKFDAGIASRYKLDCFYSPGVVAMLRKKSKKCAGI